MRTAWIACLLTTLTSLAAGQDFREPVRTHLVLLGEEGQEVGLLPVDLRPDTPVLGERFAVRGCPVGRGRVQGVVAHDGGVSLMACEPAEDGYELSRRGLDGALQGAPVFTPGPTWPLPALHQVGSLVVVGVSNRVATVDFGADVPALRVVHTRQNMERSKSYDLFARAGEWLIAIDDVVSPIYADSFRVGGDRSLTHEQGLRLPDVINGHYGLAVLQRGGPRDGTLYVVATFGTMSGSGHDLAALAIRDGQIVCSIESLQNNHSGNPPILEESKSRMGPGLELIAGQELTRWSGLALLEENPQRLLAAAGARGLLVFPARFHRRTEAEALDLGGPCLDVRALGGRVWVLVGGEAPALVELDPGLHETRRTPLPAVFHRIL